ncbi:MAG TPA: ATP-binding protein [Thermoleophilaceae bacterium]
MSLRGRLVAAFAYVLLLVLVALLVPLVLNLSRRVDAEVKAEAAGQAQLVAASAIGRLSQRDELDRLVERAARGIGGRVVVVDAHGRLLADSAGSSPAGTSYANRPEIAAALAGRTHQGTRRSDTLDQDLLYTAVPIVSGGRRVGAVRATQSVDAVNDEKRSDALTLIGLGGLALLLGIGVAWLLAGSLARPLAALAAVARRIGAGEMHARAKETGSAEQRDVARAFNEMTDRLAQALVAQREFVGNASHQLRTPLTGLKLRLEAAGAKTGDPAIARDLHAAEAELDRLETLLGELLTLAREAERPTEGEPVELGRAARAACDRWRSAAERSQHELALAGNGEVCVISSGSDLAVVLDNLVENAIAYSPAGSRVEIDWGVEGARGWLAVRDEGDGFADGDAERVFERFFRGSAGRGRPGTGLGLAIVDTLARRWGGTATAANREGGGAAAAVALPLAEEEEL